MPTILRPSRALFRFSGADAQKLLFDVVTGRLLAEPGPPLWWALLSPQGKIQAEGHSVWRDEAFWLDVDQSVADSFLKRMKMYRLRAAVTIDDLRETHAVGVKLLRQPQIGGADLGLRGVRLDFQDGVVVDGREEPHFVGRITHRIGASPVSPDKPCGRRCRTRSRP